MRGIVSELEAKMIEFGSKV